MSSREPGRRLLIHSGAFRDASLKSEERRAIAVMLLIAMISVPVLAFTDFRPVDSRLKIVGSLAGLALLAIQMVSVMQARRARRTGRDMPEGTRVLFVAIECSIPTAAILANIRLGTLPPYTALTAPPILAYGVLITLTTLRLRPALCVLGGVVAAAGYISLVLLVASDPAARLTTDDWPVVGFVMAPLLLLVTGVAAAWVAREIRGHVEAALEEAEAHRRMERLEHEIGIARTIQQALLPSGPPRVAGYDIAGWNRPADQTGGDYYDWQCLPDGRWIISLADVSGHGLGPALVTAAARAYVRASSAHHPDLGSLASHVNQLLAADLPEGRFVTMANVVLDPRGGPCALLSAGHGPIALHRASTGEVQQLLPQDPPLAVVPDSRFGPAQTIDLMPGDLLALVTDGFVEWSRAVEPDRRDPFGVDRLHESLHRHSALASADLIRAFVADVSAFAAGVPQQDDLTIVVIRRTN
ncbi:MAG: serine/threonine-protein phosphatase [Phycisphaeraceae bacterium]|nr:serine/threonine-protein phosphatase [Phycisphaeraceae bacterium]